MKSRSRILYDKSLSAMLSAIEVYNKPDFHYREETFAVLAVNSWELLLKARILQLDRNRISAIIQYEKRRNADGSLSTKRYRKKNRSGNHVSIGLFKALDTLTSNYGDAIHPLVRTTLEVLTEIRDNSIHFFNRDFGLRKRVMEVGTASLRNYVMLSRKWFGVDLSVYDFFIMPMAFFSDLASVNATPPNKDEGRLLAFIEKSRKGIPADPASDYSLALEVDIRLKRRSGEQGTEVIITNDPAATPVRLSEEDIHEKYPWEYGHLSKHLSKRYSDFLQNGQYHDIRRPLESDARYCRERFLDPGNPRSSRKCFYSPNIVKEFDKHYTKKK